MLGDVRLTSAGGEPSWYFLISFSVCALRPSVTCFEVKTAHGDRISEHSPNTKTVFRAFDAEKAKESTDFVGSRPLRGLDPRPVWTDFEWS